MCISWNIKKCFDTIDVRYKHEDYSLLYSDFKQHQTSNNT